MPKKNESKYKASYNPDRECYISADGKYLCYETTDLETRRPVTLRYEIGKDGLTEELTFLIDDINYSQDQVDCKEEGLKDKVFEAKRKRYESDPNAEDAVDPWDTIPDKGSDLATAVDAEEEQENPDVAKVREVVDTQFTDDQQELFFSHFGEGKPLAQIRQEEAAETGEEKSLQSVLNRKNRMIKKVARQAFGVEPVKRRKTKKD